MSRGAVFVLCGAIVGVAALALLWRADRDDPAERRDPIASNGNGGERVAPPPDTGPPSPAAALANASSVDLEAAVAARGPRGDDGVPDLVAFLRSGDDARTGRRWEWRDGRLTTFPTVRAAAIAALAAVRTPAATAALRDVLRLTRSTGETLLAAHALLERGVKDWAPLALDRAGGEEEPDTQHLRAPLVALAARADPGTTARRIEDRAPRGKAGRDPGVLAGGLAHLPWDAAQTAARRLLEDGTVTAKAKRRYAAAMLRRGEPDAVRVVTEALVREPVPDRVARSLVEEAIDSRAFDDDARAYERAIRAGDTSAADAIRKRALSRGGHCRALIATVFGEESGRDADRARARLDAQLARVGLE